MALDLQTAAPRTPSQAGPIDTCPNALLEPVTVRRAGTQLTFISADGSPRLVQWPRGFSARFDHGRAELVAPDGTVVAIEGDVLRNLGGSGPAPDAFNVCQIGSSDYGPAS